MRNSRGNDRGVAQNDLDGCGGLDEVRKLLAGYAELSRPVLIRGDTSTVRLLVPTLVERTKLPIVELFCSMVQPEPGALVRHLQEYHAELRRPGVLLLLEIERLCLEDQQVLSSLARDRVVDAHGTPLIARLVCHLDPRHHSVVAFPGVAMDIDVPPLASRPQDALFLVKRLLTRCVGSPITLADGTPEAIEAFPWRGGLGELVGRVERAAATRAPDELPIFSHGDLGIPAPLRSQPEIVIDADEHGRRLAEARTAQGLNWREIIDEYEAEVIKATMKRVKNNKSQAARVLGISRSYLIQKCQQYAID